MIAPSIVPAFNSMKILALESICFTVVLGIFEPFQQGLYRFEHLQYDLLIHPCCGLLCCLYEQLWWNHLGRSIHRRSPMLFTFRCSVDTAAIISISPDWTAGIKASKPMDLNSILKPNFSQLLLDKSTSKPTYLSPSVNLNGGNVVSEPTRNTPSCCVIFGLSLPQPANKPIAATATRAMAVNFWT